MTSEEQPEFAFHKDGIFDKSFIPSQHVKGSNTEVFIIKLDNSVLEISRTSDFSNPLLVRLNGETFEIVEHNEKKKIEFENATGKHLLVVWNARAKNFVFSNFISKRGLAITIDGIPVQNTMSDPIMNLDEGKIAIWGYIGLLSIKISLTYLIRSSIDSSSAFTTILPYLLILVLLIYAGLTYPKNPKKSIWFGLILGSLETLDFISGIIIHQNFGSVAILFLILRTSCLFALIRTIKTINRILIRGDLQEQVGTFVKSSLNLKTKTNFIATTLQSIKGKGKVIGISIVSIIILSTIIFSVSNFIQRPRIPDIERDSSIAFRDDLILPELIPYRKEDKWGYSNKNGEIVIEPRYSSVEFPARFNRFEVTYNDLDGIIDSQGKEVIPTIYKDIYRLPNSSLYEVKNSMDEVGVIDEENKIVIPFEYEDLYKHPSQDLYIAKKGKWGMIDGKNNIIIPFVYNDDPYYEWSSSPGLSFSDDFIIASKLIKGKTYYGLLNFDGSILLDFQNLRLSKNTKLKSHLLETSKKMDVYNSLTSTFLPQTFRGIIDKNGEIILPTIYNSFSRKNTDDDYIIITQTDYSSFTLKMGVINSVGEIIIPCVYDDIDWNFTEKYIKVKYNNLYGIINFNDRIIIPIKYEHISVQRHNNKYYFVIEDKNTKKTGLLNERQEIVIPFNYDWIRVDENYFNWIGAFDNNRGGVIDFNNNIVIPFEYYNMLILTEGLAEVKYVHPDSITSILNSNVIKDSYSLEEIHIGLSFVKVWIGIYKNPNYEYAHYTIIELKNALSDPATRHTYYESNSKYLRQYDDYESFCMRILVDDWREDIPGKWGFFNEAGELVIDFIYDNVESFKNGLAKVKFNNKWGIINRKGEVVIPIKFNEDEIRRVKDFYLFEVRNDNRETIGFIDINGIEYFEDD